MVLDGDADIPWHDVPFVNVDQFTFKHCNYFLFFSALGLAILKHVLTPRVKATHVAIDTMKDYLDAVYDVTVAYEGTVDHKGQRKLAPSMTGELRPMRRAVAVCLFIIYRTNSGALKCSEDNLHSTSAILQLLVGHCSTELYRSYL